MEESEESEMEVVNGESDKEDSPEARSDADSTGSEVAKPEGGASDDEKMEPFESSSEDENVGNVNNEDKEQMEEAEALWLEATIDGDPYERNAHVALIRQLQKMGELERLRAARERMSSLFLVKPEVWISWLRDEMRLAISIQEKAEVVTLCERAVKDFASAAVWMEYLQYSVQIMSRDQETFNKIRNLFERALTAVGLHVVKGAVIWEAFREYETLILARIEAGNAAERAIQLKRIGNLFRRQLSCPLLDMEKAHEEYITWRARHGVAANIDDNAVTRGYDEAFRKLNLYIPYEEKLITARGEDELLDAYKKYLHYEKQHGDPGRITILYERGITELCEKTSLWLDYVTYLEDKIQIESVLEPVFQRASKNVPSCSAIWQKWMRSCEKWEKPVMELQKLLENALAVTFPSAEDYRNLWIAYLEYLRRRLEESSREEEERRLNVLRNTFNRACEHLAKYFGLDGDPDCVILQYWARIEAIHANDMGQVRTLWSDILSQGHTATASYWLEYLLLERCYGDTKHLRKLYPKALSCVQDTPELIARSWLDFERDEGTLKQMEICEVKTKEKLAKVAEEREKAQEILAQNETLAQNKKLGKRKGDDTGKWKHLGCSQSKIVKTDNQIKPTLRESRLGVDKNAADTENKSKPTTAPPPGFKETEEEQADENDQSEVNDDITVFVSNLDYTATKEEVREVLKPAGPITIFRMVTDYKGRNKGYCYVQLSNEDAVEKALELDRTLIKGRPMFVSRCNPNKSTRNSGFKYNVTLEKNKLFVKGLPLKTTKEELVKIFEAFGILKEVRLVTYRNGHSKGLAYVEFIDEATATKALLATDGMKIQDKVITVAISQPPDRKKAPIADSAPIKSLGGSSTSRTVFGMPKTLLSMVPRSVKTSNSNGASLSAVLPKNNQDFRKMFLKKK